jgi:hypothetical protein
VESRRAEVEALPRETRLRFQSAPPLRLRRRLLLGTAHLRQGYGAGTCPLHATQPKTNAAFWRKKFAAHRTRDRLVTRTLRTLGWRVLRIWEHELKRRNEMRLARRILRALALTHDHAGLASAA